MRFSSRQLMNRDLKLLFFIDFIMSLGMNLTDSLRALYIQSLGATVLEISFVVSVTGLAGTLLRVPSGIFSDSRGRRNIIIMSIILSIFPPLMYTMSQNWEQLIPWGIIYSAAFAFYMPSRMALVADFTTPENRTRIYSIMGIAFPLGGTVGPTIAGLIQGANGWNMIFYSASILFMICLVPALLLPKPAKSDNEQDKEPQIGNRSKLDLTFIHPILAFVFLNLLLGLGIGTVSNITPIYLADRFSMSTADVGLFISVSSGLTMILCQIREGS
jgi:DHA1 family multidrug resistance protein-like MFS transporter